MRDFLHALLPQTCFLCGTSCQHLLCPACHHDLPYIQHTCAVCACPLPQELNICAQCVKKAPHFSSVRATLRYEYPAKSLIHAAKYRENLGVLHYLGDLMAQALVAEPDPDVLLVVPSHPRDLRRRGFNQAVELAKVISRQRAVGLAREATYCVRRKRKQARLSAVERQANVRGVFGVNLQANWRHVVLIDDVVTTGATVNELASMCLRAGAQRVDVWCCARQTFKPNES